MFPIMQQTGHSFTALLPTSSTMLQLLARVLWVCRQVLVVVLGGFGDRRSDVHGTSGGGGDEDDGGSGSVGGV